MGERVKWMLIEKTLEPTGFFSPKDYYKSGLLYSSQIGAVSQESLARAMQLRDPVKLMQSPTGSVIVYDGHHRVAIAILRDSVIAYELMEFYPKIRMSPFRYILSTIKRFLPAGIDMGLME